MDNRLFIAEENCKRLDVFLSEQLEDFTRSRLKKLIEDGNVKINGVAIKKSGADIKMGDEVAIVIPDAVEYTAKPENIPLDIVYQDGDFAVVNKPQGMTVHIGNGTGNNLKVDAAVIAHKSEYLVLANALIPDRAQGLGIFSAIVIAEAVLIGCNVACAVPKHISNGCALTVGVEVITFSVVFVNGVVEDNVTLNNLTVLSNTCRKNCSDIGLVNLGNLSVAN